MQENRGQFIRPTLHEREEFKVISAVAIEQKFKDRHVIVTGASGAVGSEVVKILLDNGAKVVIFGRDKDNLAYLKTYNSLKDIRLFKYIFDFTSFPLDLESKFREAMKDLNGVLHSVIVWHGYAEPGGIRSLNLKQWDRWMNINVRSSFMFVSLAIPFLKLQKHENPSVWIVSGNSGFRPFPGFTAFSVAKAMINSFIEWAALEMAYFGIRINGVSTCLTTKGAEELLGLNMRALYARDAERRAGTTVDGRPIDNYANQESTEHVKGNLKSLYLTDRHIPFKMNQDFMNELEGVAHNKIVEPKDVAQSVCWLWSEDASMVTGEIIKVDAGFSLVSSNYSEYEEEYIKKDKLRSKPQDLFQS